MSAVYQDTNAEKGRIAMPCKLRYSLTAFAAIALVAASAISSAQAQAKFKNTTGPTKSTNMAPWTTTHASNRSNEASLHH
jgi:hypothetical protein